MENFLFLPALYAAPGAATARRTARPLFATARNRTNSELVSTPKMLWLAGASSDPQLRRVLAVVKARRSAPPPLRGALGLDDGSAHACPDWLLGSAQK